MHDDQKTSDYPLGYTPMTDDELGKLWESAPGTIADSCRAIERAVLARLPKPDAEPVAWLCVEEGGNRCAAVSEHERDVYIRTGRKITPLYAHPPKPAKPAPMGDDPFGDDVPF